MLNSKFFLYEKKKFFYFLIGCISFLNSHLISTELNTERIISFSSNITINKDASIDIEENIRILSAGQTIKHGIFREFPTRYKDESNNNYIVGFELKEIKLDNNPVNYKIEDWENGKVIKIGDKNTFLNPGIHTYTIKYKTNRQLRLDFDGKDELYWNITGNGWPFTIDSVIATVVLPFAYNKEQIIAEGYTGYQGEQHKNYTFKIEQGQIKFQTNSSLLPYQGFTVSIAWPTGNIIKPDLFTKFKYFFYDNLQILWLLVGISLLLIFYILKYLKALQTKRPGTIIPLFEPPQNMTPGQMRFLYKKKFDKKAFASEIVNMAVKGLLNIKYEKSFWGSPLYILVKKEELPKNTENIPASYLIITDFLFSKRTRIEIDNQFYMSTALSKYFLHHPLNYDAIKENSDIIGAGSLFSFILTMPFFIFNSWILNLFSIILIGILILINIVFFHLLVTYTPQGRKLMDQIEGFKLFLTTTEEERLKIVGSPPTKTPELYEKYLPYAIALDVEKAWSKQFTPLFEKLNKEGHPYIPLWYQGNIYSFNNFATSTSFANTISSSSKSISSSTSYPGSTTGTSGRGSSGGGGGGGGGGGW